MGILVACLEVQWQPQKINLPHHALTDGAPLPASQSSALKFPGGPEWAPYFIPQQPTEHVWNPFGSGTNRGYLPLPVFRIAGELASDARERANQNQQRVSDGCKVSGDVSLRKKGDVSC